MVLLEGPDGVGLDAYSAGASGQLEGRARRRRPHAAEDGELVLEEVVPGADLRERRPVGLVLGLVPSGARWILGAGVDETRDVARSEPGTSVPSPTVESL
jgi:hypothetical protein